MQGDLTRSRRDPAGFVVAALLLVASGAIAMDAMRLDITSTYGVGPKAAPFVIAGGLALLALGNFVLGWRGDFPRREEADPKAILLISGGFAILIALIAMGGGFIPATAILFATTATAFGRRTFFLDLLIGLALGLVVYLLFDKLLTLSLPAGPIERLF